MFVLRVGVRDYIDRRKSDIFFFVFCKYFFFIFFKSVEFYVVIVSEIGVIKMYVVFKIVFSLGFFLLKKGV